MTTQATELTLAAIPTSLIQEISESTSEKIAADSEKADDSPPPEVHQFSAARRYILLFTLSLCQFLDTFNNGALFSAIPIMTPLLDLSGGEAIWLISAYQMLMASFLLISGRISDLYTPKIVFLTGTTGIIILSIVAGFVQEKIALIVLRALLGICAALTIPSALALIIYLFPDPKEQAGAISVFGACGALGGIVGIILGAVLTQYGSWHWVFYFVGVVAAPVALGVLLLCPSGITTGNAPKHLRGIEKVKTIDLFGIFLLTGGKGLCVLAGLTLFMFAVIQATAIGWVQAGVLVPLILGAGLVVAFFYWETKLPEDKAAMPPRLWFYPNFIFIICLALIPYGYVNAITALFSSYWQDQLGYSVIEFAIHLLPLTIAGIPAIAIFGGPLSSYMAKKWLAVGCLLIMMASAIVFRFANSPDRYWSFVFHTFIWGSVGFSGGYMFVNVGAFRCTPPTIAGTVGAIIEAALQLGSALGTAIVTSIQQSVGENPTGTDYQSKFAGYAAAFTFYASLMAFLALVTLVAYKPEKEFKDAHAAVEAETQDLKLSESDTGKEFLAH